MDAQDKERFVSNVTWFNRFFEDLKLLFERIAKALENEFSWSERGYYYPKSNNQPSIPAYYFMGLGGESFAVQVYAVLDLSLFENNPYLKKDRHWLSSSTLWGTDICMAGISVCG